MGNACDPGKPVGPPLVGKAPAWAMVTCADLAKIQGEKLVQWEVFRVLGEDAKAYRTCQQRHAALVRYINHRDSLLAGKKAPSLKD